MPCLFYHIQKQASGNTLARDIFKEQEHYVIFMFAYIFFHMMEGKRSLWPLPMQLASCCPWQSCGSFR